VGALLPQDCYERGRVKSGGDLFPLAREGGGGGREMQHTGNQVSIVEIQIKKAKIKYAKIVENQGHTGTDTVADQTDGGDGVQLGGSRVVQHKSRREPGTGRQPKDMRLSTWTRGGSIQ